MKIYKRCIALFLCFLLTFTHFQGLAFAEGTNNEEEQVNTEMSSTEPTEENDEGDLEETEKPLYTDDTVFIYNELQLEAVGTDRPVMTGDAETETFGVGNLTGHTYNDTENYIVSDLYTDEVEDPIYLNAINPNNNSEFVDGRNYFGQTTIELDGTTYILIGCRQQLQAIDDSSSVNVFGPVYAVDQVYTRNGFASYEWVDQPETARIVYPGDADLIDGIYTQDGVTEDFSDKPLFGNARVGHLVGDYDYRDLGTEGGSLVVGSTRTVYCAGSNGTYDTSKHNNNDNRENLTYSTDGNYIVFRDIDLRNEAWTPLMFSGTMYGVVAEDGEMSLDMDASLKPVISNVNVTPKTLTQLGQLRLNLNDQTGVGFFGTVSGKFNGSAVIEDKAIVKNIKLKDVQVENLTTKADVDQTLVNGLLTALGTVLGVVLDPVLKLLIGKDVGVRAMLTGLLDARAKDPSSLATGSFAGRIIGSAEVSDCEVQNSTITTVKTTYEDDHKIVGKGGFVGSTNGETEYEIISQLIGTVGDALSTLLNIIPGLGLGDLISVLLDNALPLQNLIPTGYVVPTIDRCVVDNCTLSTEEGKLGVGGFVGHMAGTVITNCTVKNSEMTVNADEFGGGFAGVVRDDVIEGTLNALGVDVAASLHPQSELISCSIENSDITVTGNSYLGGFTGVQANSYAIDCTIDDQTTMTVNGHGDYVSGFCGYARLGTLFGMGDYLVTSNSLLGTVKGLVTGLLGNGSDQSLLDLGGVSPSAIMGCEINGPLRIESEGNYVGGFVGRGDGVYLTTSSDENMILLAKYKRGKTELPDVEERGNTIRNLVYVKAGEKYAGGIAGYLTSANVGGLLGDTAGIGQYLGFTVSDTIVNGIEDGFDVMSDNYAAGGIAWAVGGDVTDSHVKQLRSVTSGNHAGGFVGSTGPGDLVSGNGLDLQLLGIQLISIDNLLSLVSSVRTTYTRATVTGIPSGFTVETTGERTGGDQTNYLAGGFASESNSVIVKDCHVSNLRSVTANTNDGIAGGFLGFSTAGGLAGVVEENASLSVAQVGNLLNAVPYLVPSYQGCTTTYVDGGFVEANTAGGFAGEFQCGKINTDTMLDNADDDYYDFDYGTSGNPYSVFNVHHVRGGEYAGGWGGKVYSGALVSAGGGLSLLGGATNVSINAQDLLGLAQVYIPIVKYAGVNTYSETQKGFSVYGDQAGGFIGYGSGVQVSYSDVNKLKTGNVTEPTPLEGKDGSAYMRFDNDPYEIPYAVAGKHYAGGYIGYMDVGSAATVGGGLQLLGKNLQLTNVLDALSVVVSTIEHSNVYGAPGGFSVVSSEMIDEHDGNFGNIGYAGGFAGKVSGGHIQDSNVEQFIYIIGEVAAGGYAGEIEPGDVAHVLDSGSLSLLGELDSVASLVQDFVPTIRNSQTTCVPCGGAVRAQTFSDDSSNMGHIVRGMAGGYVGHNKGGQIWGNDTHTWKEENSEQDLLGKYTRGEYTGTKRECAAIRIRSVYGAEYSGGYCGLMECASTAQTGGLSLLGGLINASNLLGALETVYPTIHYGAVYGPLEMIDYQTWNAWVQYIGPKGGYAYELQRIGTVESQEELEEILSRYIYGYHVVAGRDEYDNWDTTYLSGCAGGFVGSMHGGSIKNSHGEDAKLVSAMRATGGFVGEMQTKGLAEFGGVSLFGDALQLNLGKLLSVGNVFVPAIENSGVTGYQQGLTVQCFGKSHDDLGHGGGYVGASYGGQIDTAWVRNLKLVKATNTIGGFVGRTRSASLLSADTHASNGFLQKLLDTVISTPTQLLDVLNATICTIKTAEVSALDNRGFVIDGQYDDATMANYAGGFGGDLEATVIGKRKGDDIRVNGLRGVSAKYYAGGFFGLADVRSVANVHNSNILSLIQTGNISLLDAFRTYIYYAHVTGVPTGITVYTSENTHSGTMGTYRVNGTSGGFGGGLMNGTVEHSDITNLSYVESPHYAGGFIGYMGKNGGVSVDQVNVTNESLLGKLLSVLGLNLDVGAQVLDIVGSTVKDCRTTGIEEGFVTRTTARQAAIYDLVDEADLTLTCSGGFTGYADVSQIEDCHVDKLKIVEGKQIAGGFIGRTSVAYIADVDVSSYLTDALIQIVNMLLRILYLDQLQDIDLLDLNLPGLAEVSLLTDGNLLYVNLFGIKIGVSLVKNDPEYGGNKDAAIITLGSSTIKVPCTEDGGVDTSDPNISISLIEGNRTSVKNSTVTGIEDGYDVIGGLTTEDHLQSDGYAGGFCGFNDNGYLSHNRMWLCDTIEGQHLGPFIGYSIASSRPISYLEGNGNEFSIYRSLSSEYTEARTKTNVKFADAVSDQYNRYDTTHLDVIKTHSDLEDAIEKGTQERDLNAYAGDEKEILMLDVKNEDNEKDDLIIPDEMLDPCEPTFDLSIHKQWQDYHNLKKIRPDSLTVRVYRVPFGMEPPEKLILTGDPVGVVEQEYVMTIQPEDRPWSDMWNDVLKNLYTQKDGIYYQYYVKEDVPGGYEAEYEVDQKTATVTIRNHYKEELPETGGSGYTEFYFTGFFMICLAVLLLLRKRKRSNSLR